METIKVRTDPSPSLTFLSADQILAERCQLRRRDRPRCRLPSFQGGQQVGCQGFKRTLEHSCFRRKGCRWRQDRSNLPRDQGWCLQGYVHNLTSPRSSGVHFPLRLIKFWLKNACWLLNRGYQALDSRFDAPTSWWMTICGMTFTDGFGELGVSGMGLYPGREDGNHE